MSRSMHIGMIMDTFPSLSETFILHHITGLLDAGHEVTIFARRPPRRFPKVHPHVEEYKLMDRVRYLRHQEWSPRQLMYVPYTLARSVGRPGTGRCLNAFRYGPGVFRFRALHGLEQARGLRFDLLHCHYASIGWAFAAYRDVFNAPLVTSFHGDHYGSFGRDGRWLLSRLFQRGDAFVANSEFTKSELVRLGCRAEKVRVIPAMVNHVGTRFSEPQLGRNPIRLLTVARMHESKGISVALKAVRLLLDRGEQVTYRIAGDGPHRPQFESLARELRLGDSVTFLGWMDQSEVYGLYGDADIFVLPSLISPNGANEAQGLVIQEAQLHGLPVVASHIGGIPESLDHGAAGLLFTVNDPSALAARIHELIAAPTVAREMAIHAERYAREKYTREPVMRHILELYGELTHRHVKGGRSNAA